MKLLTICYKSDLPPGKPVPLPDLSKYGGSQKSRRTVLQEDQYNIVVVNLHITGHLCAEQPDDLLIEVDHHIRTNCPVHLTLMSSTLQEFE